jgi:eukaryotic-like serine/threonine-protein kinase
MERDPFDLVGDVLDGQFRVDAFAGEGDLSVVYKGHHLGVDAPVAIKCLNLPDTLDPALARPLVDGFKQASSVHYRLARGNLHIAQTIASGSTLVPRSGVVVPYLVREWFEGESLASDLARRRTEKRGGRSIEEALALLETAFDGIAHAHAEGEVHLSINPSNLFVVGQAGTPPTPRLKVLDFGVARTMNTMASGIGAGLRLLFPAYAAPEQLDRGVGALGPWTDVYAIALVMMEVLSDRPVMREADSGAIVEHALDENRRPTPAAHGITLPSHIERALNRAVARAPAKRQRNAAELWRDVRNSARTLAPRSISSGSMTAAVMPSRTPTPMPSRTPTPMPSRAPDAVPSRTPATMPVPSRTPMPFPSHLTMPIPAHAAQTQAPQALSAPWQAPAPGAVRATIPMPALSPRTVPGLPSSPRMRAPTLVGLSPPAAALIPGAAENRHRAPASPSVSTRPMSFEPRAATPPPAFALFADAPSVAPPADFGETTAATDDHAQASAAPVGHAIAAASPALPAFHRETLSASSPPPAAPPPDRSPFYAGPPPASHWRSPYADAPTDGAAPAPSIDLETTPSSNPSLGLASPPPGREREDWDTGNLLRTPSGRPSGVLGRILTPRSTPIVLTVAGGLFWCWGFCVFVWLVVMPWRHPRPATSPAAIAEVSAPAPAAAAVPEPAPALAAAPATASGSPSAPAPEPPTPAASERVAAAPQGSPFKNAAAVRALDGKWRDIARCRRGKIWGKASTTITFANDGSVTHVDVGSPFAGTPTADCIASALTSVHVAPFDDEPAALVYRVYVAPK